LNRDIKSDQEFRNRFINRGKVTWRVYVAAVVLSVLGILFDRKFPGLSRSLGSAGAAILGIIVVKRRYWHYSWFWLTFAALIIVQLPLILLTKPLMDYLKFVFMWIFALVDLFAMSLVIEIIAGHFEET
jgi:hypothetical protein